MKLQEFSYSSHNFFEFCNILQSEVLLSSYRIVFLLVLVHYALIKTTVIIQHVDSHRSLLSL